MEKMPEGSKTTPAVIVRPEEEDLSGEKVPPEGTMTSPGVTVPVRAEEDLGLGGEGSVVVDLEIMPDPGIKTSPVITVRAEENLTGDVVAFIERDGKLEHSVRGNEKLRREEVPVALSSSSLVEIIGAEKMLEHSGSARDLEVSIMVDDKDNSSSVVLLHGNEPLPEVILVRTASEDDVRGKAPLLEGEEETILLDPSGSGTAAADGKLEAEKGGSSSWFVDMEKARWNQQCIYRVPEFIKKMTGGDAYQPQFVSLGPLHHGEPGLVPMEEHKRRAVLHLVNRAGKPLGDFVAAIQEVAGELQAAYSDLDDGKWCGSNTGRFVEMMVTDGCFLLEMMRKDEILSGGETDDDEYAANDPVFGDRTFPTLWPIMRTDMIAMENQLPLVVLERLLAVQHGTSVLKLHDGLEAILLNLMAYEWLHPDADHDVASYISFVDKIIDDKKVVEMFHKLTQLALCPNHSRLGHVQRKVNVYCKKPWNRWRASFTNTYLSNPWVFISLMAAIFLLIAALLQTVYTILSFYKG
ncbi:hypothetical protein U9M48_002518 [Paspalum notatum var. saurae]|uniref:Uncharacterized protein n=1 Tax=Paspalum notatum var. saurae TaxID=547442 RepID=A0AAQ3PQT2_PASNO